jgi:hypothetical protein
LFIDGFRSLPEYCKDMRKTSKVKGSQNEDRVHLWKTYGLFLGDVYLNPIYIINYSILNPSISQRNPNIPFLTFMLLHANVLLHQMSVGKVLFFHIYRKQNLVSVMYVSTFLQRRVTLFQWMGTFPPSHYMASQLGFPKY